MLDRAIGLVRAGGLRVVSTSWAGGSLVAGVVLGTYYLERVEGITTLRPGLALALVLAWWARAWLLGGVARGLVKDLWDAPMEEGAGRAVDVLRTSVVAGLGLWVWSWLLVGGSLAGPVGVVLFFPFLSFRGAFAPSWIARAACTSQGGLRVFFAAMGDNAGRRGAGVATEALILFGALGLAINLYVTCLGGLLFARSFMGIEVATLESFLSPSNTFFLLTIGAVTLVLLEPLRAALSAACYVDARVRSDGLDLRAAVEEAIAHASGERPGRSRTIAVDAAKAAVLVLALVFFGTSAAHAQDAPPPSYPPPPMSGQELETPAPARPEAPAEPSAEGVLPSDPGALPTIETEPVDRGVEEQVNEILAQDEFREFEDHRGEGLRHLFERLFDWLLRPREELPSVDAPGVSGLSLPGPWVFLAIAAVLLFLVGVYLWVTRNKEREAHARAESAIARSEDLRERPPASFLDEAARLAAEGDFREALRQLYLATLVSLDRRRVIAFDPHLTNWQYLQQMPRNATRESFRHFTKLFDHKWYGREATTSDDYERCRSLATEIVAVPETAQ
jgi:hypothetical protein